MWRGYPEALAAYGLAIVHEWTARGHADTCEAKILDDLPGAGVDRRPRNQAELAAAGALPPWLGDEMLHRSHRSALLRKDPDHYGPLFDEPDDLPYVWPDGPPAEG
jgi:diadenosine tetraphosphatase ApaH/serine/threonine PP2A family protein phosphatase